MTISNALGNVWIVIIIHTILFILVIILIFLVRKYTKIKCERCNKKYPIKQTKIGTFTLFDGLYHRICINCFNEINQRKKEDK